MAAEPAALRIRGLGYSRQDGEQRHRVLNGLDLTIAAGETVAVLGPSGSGKTSLLHLAAGLLEADQGHIEINGEAVSGRSETERAALRRRHIGFVFQFFHLLPMLTVLENCALPLELNGDPVDRDEIMVWLDGMGLADRADSRPDRLSGGEQQRLALIRALIHRPALVLADEPTGNLDDAAASRARRLLFDQLRHRGTAALIATHSEALAAEADRRLFLRGGVLHNPAA